MVDAFPVVELDGPRTGTYVVSGKSGEMCIIAFADDFVTAMSVATLYLGDTPSAIMGIVGAYLCPVGSRFRQAADFYQRRMYGTATRSRKDRNAR